MASRRIASMLLRSMTSAGLRSELHAGSMLSNIKPTQQLTTLSRWVSAPALSTVRQRAASGIRAFSTEIEPLGLKEAVKGELDYEHDNYEPPEGISQPPGPWTLTESPGDSKLLLKRQYNDETIEVKVISDEATLDEDDDDHPLADAQPQDAEDEDVDVDIDVSMVATASITKGKRTFDIDFRTDGTYVQVIDVSLGGSECTGADDETTYAGPEYGELDERVQHAFDAYLEERGIDAEFGGYLMRLTQDKEQREYVNWLQKLHEFV